MGSEVRYGFCVGCQRWVPRDEMLSINTDIYHADNWRETVRQRYCADCWRAERGRATKRRWDHLLVPEEMLAPMKDGSAPSNQEVRRRYAEYREDRWASLYAQQGGDPNMAGGDPLPAPGGES